VDDCVGEEQVTKNCRVLGRSDVPLLHHHQFFRHGGLDNCSVDDQPGACAQYLIAKV